eukprot:Gb_37752 [translate_table: standard]
MVDVWGGGRRREEFEEEKCKKPLKDGNIILDSSNNKKCRGNGSMRSCQLAAKKNDVIGTITRAVKRARGGLKDLERPIAAMLFCGPTRVGNIELTKALVEYYFGSMNTWNAIL